jgi:hypothetical protein
MKSNSTFKGQTKFHKAVSMGTFSRKLKQVIDKTRADVELRKKQGIIKKKIKAVGFMMRLSII